MPLDDLLASARNAADAALGRAEAAGASMRERLSGLGDLSQFGGDKLGEIADGVNAAIPLITEAGYALTALQLELGIPPKIIVRAAQSAPVTPERLDELRARAEALPVGSAIVLAFLKAVALSENVTLGGLKAREIELEIGALPAVRLIYSRA
ncbi:MAG: hypothetical protein NW201_02365 [Gemmatimonadales bacterium]|nr:hypothetical protein [Gemmatimonadales bacterium]